MKKNFLKKLASVLSLALVVSTITPAASASAAAAPNLAKRYTNVYEGNGYAYTVKNAKGHTVKWTVSGAGAEYVKLSKKTGASTKLTVNTEGEVAAKNKNVTVKANFYKGGKLVKAAGDVVKVKVSAKDIAIVTAESNVDLTAVAAGEVVDFNRALTPKNATSLTTWSVTDKDGNATTDADIDGTGNFKADKVGEYVVKAVARNAKNGKDIVAAEQAVKVVLAIKDVKQLSLNKVQVTFGADASKVVTKTNIAVEAKDTKANSYVKEVTFTPDGKTATVTVYNNFVDKKEYTVTYDKKAVGFIASVGEVTQVTIKDKIVKYGEATPLDIKLLDANGIDVTTSAEMARVTAKSTNNIGWVEYPVNGVIKATLFNIGDVSTVEATYVSGKYDTNGKSIDIVSNIATITAVKELSVTGTVKDFTAVRNSKNPDWAKTVKKVAKKDDGKLFVKFNIDDKEYDSFIEGSGDATNLVKFEASNANVLIVNADGTYKAIAEGTAHVTATYKNYVGVFAIEVGPERKVTSISLDKGSARLSNLFVAGTSDEVTFTAKLKDQYGDDMTVGALDVERISGPKVSGSDKGLDFDKSKAGKVTFYALDGDVKATSGEYRYKLSDEGLSAVVTINVGGNSSYNTATSYVIEQSSKEFDLKVNENSNIENGTVLKNVIKIAKYNAAGDKLGYATNTDNLAISVDGPNPYSDLKQQKPDVVNGEIVINLVTATTSEPLRITKEVPTGDYQVKLEEFVNGSYRVRATTSFKVTDTQPLPGVVLDTIKATNMSVATGAAHGVYNALYNSDAISAVFGDSRFENGVSTNDLDFVGIKCTSANVVAENGVLTNTNAKGTYEVYINTIILEGKVKVGSNDYAITYEVNTFANQGHKVTIVID